MAFDRYAERQLERRQREPAEADYAAAAARLRRREQERLGLPEDVEPVDAASQLIRDGWTPETLASSAYNEALLAHYPQAAIDRARRASVRSPKWESLSNRDRVNLNASYLVHEGERESNLVTRHRIREAPPDQLKELVNPETGRTHDHLEMVSDQEYHGRDTPSLADEAAAEMAAAAGLAGASLRLPSAAPDRAPLRAASDDPSHPRHRTAEDDANDPLAGYSPEVRRRVAEILGETESDTTDTTEVDDG